MKPARAIWSISVGVLLLAIGFFIGMRWHSQRAVDASSPIRETEVTRAPANTGAAGSGSAATHLVDRDSSPSSDDHPGSAREILARLAELTVSASEPRGIRELLLQLERLREAGSAALPAIREFLASGKDADYDSGLSRGLRDGKVPTDFAVPPSLRLGLLEVVKNIGGAAAEYLLARELESTGRGVEAAYLAGVLQQIAPEKYRDTALAAARDLLAMPLTAASKNPLDRSDRDYLYGMLAAAGDRSQIAVAQTQLLLPNGQIDRGALRYLQHTLGEQSIAVAAQAWMDPRVPANQKEPLARVALTYVGANDRAEQLYQVAINDAALSDSARKNLIEDLNETGFADPKNLTPADLPLIQKRLALIDQLAPRAKDATNAAAFAEARKDLINMRDSLLRPTPPKK